MKKYCYHITDSVTRSALISGTVTAPNMEAAAEKAASRSGLTKQVETDSLTGKETYYWAKDKKRRLVYVSHDPLPVDHKSPTGQKCQPYSARKTQLHVA